MNILFIVARYPVGEDTTLEKDLVKIFSNNGHNCFVAVPLEKKFNEKTVMFLDDKIRVLRIRTGNLFNNVKLVQKAITLLKLPWLFKKAVISYYGKEKIDLIITYTPFMADPWLINKLKNYYGCQVLLMLWDIFPQNAIDLGLMKNKFLISYYSKKQLESYKLGDVIAPNTEAGCAYIKGLSQIIGNKETILVRNGEFTTESSNKIDKVTVRKKHGLASSDFVFVFGGNIGKPQKLENILFLAEKLVAFSNIKFIFIGQGTEKSMLESRAMSLSNVAFRPPLPRVDYEELLSACDMGLVSLDERYTVPNFPSKLTGYMKLSLPIFAFLDQCSYNDLGQYIRTNGIGYTVLANQIEKCLGDVIELTKSPDLLVRAGEKARKCYENDFIIENSYEAIVNAVQK